MEKPLAAYKGDAPYVFVSYSHADEDVVFAEIRWLQYQGINVWYDTTGIGPGSEWNDEIARAIKGASQFLFFITPNSVASEHCRQELNFAQTEGRRVIVVHLEMTNLPDGLRLSLDNRQAILKYKLDLDLYYEALLNSVTTNSTKRLATECASQAKRPARLIIGMSVAFVVIAVIAVIAATVIWRKGAITLAPIEFSESSNTPSTLATQRETDIGGTQNAEAYAHYAVGNELYNVDPERALEELEEAVRIDPEFAQAWVSIAWAHGVLSRNPEMTDSSLAQMANAAARAVSVAPDLWEAHNALGFYLLSRRDFSGADRAFRQMVDLANRVNVLPHPGYPRYLSQLGRNSERLEFIELVKQREQPLFPTAVVLYYLGRRNEAIAELERTREIRTIVGGVKWWEELELWLTIERGDQKEIDKQLFVGTPLEGLWGTKEFTKVLRERLEPGNPQGRGQFAYAAILAAQHSDLELAVELLRREYLRDGFGSYHFIWHPLLSEVRATIGFKDFLTEIGLVELFRQSGNWNDYCDPMGSDDFRCS